MSNLDLWSKVEKTDPKNTKQSKIQGRDITSITPMSQIKAATEQFGVYGEKWGIEPDSERFTQDQIGETTLLSYDAILFCGQSRLPIHACEKLAYKTSGGSGYLKIDTEARKKVVTNALTKGLSMLGFNADIFMGLFDDIHYVEQVRTEKDIESAEDKNKEVNNKQQGLIEYVENNINAINGAPSITAAKGIARVAIAHLERQRAIPELTTICDRGLSKISKLIKEKGENDVN